MFKSTISVINNVNQTNKIKVKSDLLEIYTEIFNALPSLQLTYLNIRLILFNILNKYGISSNEAISELLNSISDKRTANKNGKRFVVYDFTKLKLLLGK